MGGLRGRSLLLAALVATAAVRAVASALILPIWDPIDERAHYAYVEGLAEGRGIAGLDDPLPLSVQRVAKASPTGTDLSAPLGPSDLDGQQHEAAQGPLVYALLVPAHLLADGWEPAERILAVRVANALLTVVPTVLLTWAIAMVLFPARPSIPPLATGLLIGWQALDIAGARVSNDGVVIPLVLVAVYAIARVGRDGPALRWAVLAGGAAGLAVLAKATTAAAAPVLAVAVLGAMVAQRVRPARAARWIAVAALCAALPVLPWLAYLDTVYSPGGAVEAFNTQVGPLIGRFPPTLGTLARYARDALTGLFGLDYRPFPQRSLAGLVAVYAVLLPIGWAVVWRRGQRGDAWHLLWLAAAVPLTFLGLAAFVQLALDGYGVTPGRYLYPALPLLAIAVAGAARLGLGLVGGIAVVVLVAVSVQHQVAQADTFVSASYLRDLPAPGLAPVVVQEHADAVEVASTITVTGPCTPRMLVVGFPEPPPATLRIRDAGGERTIALQQPPDERPGAVFGSYPLGGGPAAFSVVFDPPGQRVLAAAADLDPAVALTTADGRTADPVLRVACEVADPEALRFTQVYWPQHPDLTLGTVRAWPRVWTGVAWAAAALVTVTTLVRTVAGRRTRSASTRAGPARRRETVGSP